MKMHNSLRVLAFAAAAVFSAGAAAEIAGAQFSAEMVTQGPDGQTRSGMMYVGDGQMRLEVKSAQGTLVRILDQKQNKEWLLFPDKKTYMQRDIPAGQASELPATPSAERDPCTGMQGMTCKRVGEEKVNGRAAVKWEMSVSHEGQTLTGSQWIDKERGLPLKYVLPNGETMELKMLGKETVNGREAEKWQMTTTVPQKEPSTALQWYDPQLKLAVREEFPGGFVRELKDVKVGTQDAALFKVPDGFTLTEAPHAPQ